MSNQSDPETDPVAEGGGLARETDVQESDPNADSPEGLAGGMGVSSERVGHVRGSDEPATYGARETYDADPPGDAAPEQSSEHTHLDENPVDPPDKRHDGRGHGYPSAPDQRGEHRKGD